MTKKQKPEKPEIMNLNDTFSDAVQLINDNRLASADVPPAKSVAYYEALAEYCTDRANELRQEHGVDDDDIDLDEVVDG